MSKILQAFKCRHLTAGIVLMAVSLGLLILPPSAQAQELTPVYTSEASEEKVGKSVPTGHHEKLSVLVYLKPGVDHGPVRAFAEKEGIKVQYEYKVVMPNVLNLRNVPETALSGLQNIPGVVKVEEDHYYAKVINLHDSTPLIRGLQSQITGEGYSADGAGVRVCICDTGIDSDHLMYSDRIDAAAGYDFYNDDSDPEDDNGHGSHVAGIAVGGTDLSADFGCGAGSQPFQGVAPEATLIGVKILNQNGGGYDSDIIAGINYCADQSPSGGRADVINLSIGTGNYSGPCTHSWAVAANNAVANGVVVVAASGNENYSNAMCSPACGADVIAVGMTWKADYPTCEDPYSIWPWGICIDISPVTDDVGCFSNESDYLDVTAPGANVWSASIDSGGSSIVGKSGTSMSSPHVAGLAALILGVDSSLAPADVRQIIRDGAIDMGTPGFDRAYGYGRIDVINSLALISQECSDVSECDDSNPCTTDSCSGNTCHHDPMDCDDSDLCTTDYCSGGTCYHDTKDCSDSNPCTTDSCIPTTGACENTNNTDSCDDGEPCTHTDTCSGGVCEGTAYSCDDGNPCTDNICLGNGTCDYPNNTDPCDDGDACTTNDTCSDGSCEGGPPLNCDDADECTSDECVDGVCQNIPIVPCCGNGTCESGEDCHTCSNDCFEGSGAVCGNNVCETADNEDCQSCPDDCNGILTGKPSDRYCCGYSGQYGVTCADPEDRCTGNGNTCSTELAGSTCCGDGQCQGTEDQINCQVDCACTGPGDCVDGNECTSDECVGGVCQNDTLPDDTSCSGSMDICCSGTCTTPACNSAADCDDAEDCTTDTCFNDGTCNAYCDNAWPACGLADGCCDPSCASGTDPDCPECSPSGASCTQDSDCCSNKCLGKPGSRTCK